jgi:hypothetical protein
MPHDWLGLCGGLIHAPLRINLWRFIQLSMSKKITIIQWLAWFYCANFLFIVTLSHWPGLTDANGRLMGLFAIDPVDDIFHLLSGLVAAVVAWHSHRWSVNYFKIAGIPYGIDALTGIFGGVEFLNGDVFTEGFHHPDFSVRTLLVNLPHILIPVTMLWIGFWLGKRVAPPA